MNTSGLTIALQKSPRVNLTVLRTLVLPSSATSFTDRVWNFSACGDQMLKIAIGVAIGVIASAFLILAFPTQTVDAIHKYLPKTAAAAESFNPKAPPSPTGQ